MKLILMIDEENDIAGLLVPRKPMSLHCPHSFLTFLKQFLQFVLYKDLSDQCRQSSAVPYANFPLCCFFCPPPSLNLFNHQALPGLVQRDTCQAKSHARTTPTRSRTQICWVWLNVFVPGGTGQIQAFPSLLILQICHQKKQHENWPGYFINILFSWWW